MEQLKVVVSNDKGEELKLDAEIIDKDKFKVNDCEFEFDKNSEYNTEDIISCIRKMF